MAFANPFRGLRFDPAVVGDPGLVVAPPYDVISPEARDAYEAASPYNVVRLILAKEGGDGLAQYQQSAKLLTSWVDERALVLEPVPAVYVYEQAYELDGVRRFQRGVMASVPLDATATWVLPHERTMAAPISDRLRLLEATAVNLSPVFGLYSGGGRTAGLLAAISAGQAAIDCSDELGIRHRLWPVTDPERIAEWQDAVAERQVLIADGHHRYQTSLAYRDAMRNAHPERPAGPWDEVLMFLADGDADGPSVLPIHRLCAGLTAEGIVSATADVFTATPVADVGAAERELDKVAPGVPAFGVYGQGRSWVLVASDPDALAAEVGAGRPPLDVEILHGPVLGRRLGVVDFERRVVYEAGAAHAARQVDEGRFGALLLLRPVTAAAVLEVARSGGTLPQKTTFFYPKPRDGLVMRPLHPGRYARAEDEPRG
jgi:uncharacterized protein (DUF1015 family)